MTVLKGTWWVGEGEMFQPEKIGNGPVKSIHAEVDAKGQAVAINGPYPEDPIDEGRGGRYGRARGRRGAPPPPVDPDQTPPTNPQLLPPK